MKLLNDLKGNIDGTVRIESAKELAIIIEALTTYGSTFPSNETGKKILTQFKAIRQAVYEK